MNEILKVQDLSVSFASISGCIYAVNHLSFKLQKGECLAIVGESGSGKSVTARAILRILEPNASVDSGEIIFDGRNLCELKEKEMRGVRGNRIAMVFQDPMNALNPSYSIYKQLREVYQIHGDWRKNYKEEIIRLLGRVNIPEPEKMLDRYPFELSGGMRQRVILAMACALDPDVIIADEPTSALDVSTQAEILELMKEMAREMGSAILLITHDMGVVAEMADRVLVMYCGRKAEERDVESFFKHPCHPYTIGLLDARPQHFDGRFHTILGTVPPGNQRQDGCAFAERCEYATKRCRTEIPKEVVLNDGGIVNCFREEKGETWKREANSLR